jgi:hypothetical protein
MATAASQTPPPAQPQSTPAQQPTVVQTSPAPQATQPAQPKAPPPQANNTEDNKVGEAVIQEIANVITAKGDDDIPYFSEDEKEEARQLISTVTADDNGIKELRDFKDFLSELLVSRRNPAKAQPQESLKQAA